MIRRLVILIVLAAGCLVPVGARAAEYQVGPRGVWVLYEELPVPDQPALELVDHGTVYLLFDRQIDARGQTRRQYTRVARTFVDQIGLLEAAEVEIAFDPAFQSVVVHGVRLVRNGRTLDRLDRSRVHVVESDGVAATGIYDGSRSLVVLMPDVRVGDTLEYEYTTIGSNPVFAGHLIEEFPVQWAVPLGQFRYRVIAPVESRLRYRSHATALMPNIVSRGGAREWIWSDRDVPARLAEDRLPAWYHPYGFVELSDFADWDEVASWANGLFRHPDKDDGRIARLAAEIASAESGKTERAAMALRIVQEEIRYLAIEIGENSHRPVAPDAVLERRFGDCKDKSLLLVSLLAELGIDASVALVSTSEGGRLGRRLASPLVLDHAVVRIDYGDARGVVWVDPTLVYQRGGDTALSSRVFGRALVVAGQGAASGAAAGAALEEIRAPVRSRTDTEITMRMELARGERPTWMRVDTLHRDTAAEIARREIRSSSVAAAEKAYRNYYAGLYPSLSSREPMHVHDDEQANEIRLREEYRIERFWTLTEGSSRYEGELFPLELANLIEFPETQARTMPLAVDHPRHVIYTIRAEIDLGWAVEPSEMVIEDGALRFVRSISAEGDELVLRYEYQTLEDHVPVAAAPAHMRHLERIRRLLAYPVSRPVDVQMAATVAGPSALNWPKVFAALTIAVFAFSFTAAVVGLRYHPTLLSDAAPGTATPALGGPLNLVVLALAVLVVGAAHDLVSNVMPTLQPHIWVALTSSDSASFHPFWAPYLMYAIVARLAVIAWLVVVIVACLRRSVRTPALAVAGLFLTVELCFLEADCFRAVGLGLIDQAGLPSIERVGWNLAVAAAVCFATTPYLLWSRRARRTFGALSST